MAGQWKHGWIPLTAAAIRSKNHGSKPGKGSKLGRKKPAAKKPAVKTPAGRREIMRRGREREDALSKTARDAAARAGFTGPPKKKPHRKSALKRGR